MVLGPAMRADDDKQVLLVLQLAGLVAGHVGERDLQAIANGPIMEPLALYLPAGKVSEAEYQERLKLDYERAGIAQEPTK